MGSRRGGRTPGAEAPVEVAALVPSAPDILGRDPRRRGKSRGEDTRRAVLRAAEQVFARLGYAGARMEDVAERVGIRRASLVYYYRDKDALYQALLDDLF